MRIVCDVGLDDLREINVRSKGLFYGINIGSEGHRSKFARDSQSAKQHPQQRHSRSQIALAHLERGDQLRVGVNRAERPNVANLGLSSGRDMPFFLADESPHFIELQMLAGQIPHLAV